MLDSKKSHGKLPWFITIVLLGLSAYQVYSGVFLSKIGVPGLFELEFAQPLNPENTAPRPAEVQDLSPGIISVARTPVSIPPMPVVRFEKSSAGEKAHQYFDRCSAGDGPACNSLGIIVGDGKGVLKLDYSASAVLYERACALDNALGCKNLARRYKLGKGVDQDIRRTIEYYAKSCELKFAKACYYLGRVYELGQAGHENVTLAGSWYNEGCQQGDDSSCQKR